MGLFSFASHLIAPATKALGIGGGGGGPAGPAGPTMEQMSQDYAGQLTPYAPGEEDYLRQVGGGLQGLNTKTNESIDQYANEANNLDTLNQDAFDRSYKPAFQQLMHDYKIADQGILDNMNDRGIISSGSSAKEADGSVNPNTVGFSSPETYARTNLAYDTKTLLNSASLEAQQQAMNQKLEQFKAKSTVPQLRMNNEENQQAKVVTPQADRMQVKANTAGNYMATKLGNQTQQNAINSQRKIAGQQQLMGAIGGGLGALGSLAMLCDENAKTNIDEWTDDDHEDIINKLQAIKVSDWDYKPGRGDGGHHIGGMVQDMPDEVKTPDGKHVDVISYLGVLTAAVNTLARERGYGRGFRALATRR